jgi:phage terminase large subunit
MIITKEFAPLFQEDFMVCDLYGGRGRGGSYHLTAHALYELLYNKDLRGFFIRQTSTTIYSSMWQDLKDRMNEAVEAGFNLSHIEISDNQLGDNTARNKITGATIKTSSFQTSSGKNTAKLKSLAGASNLWIEELEEVNESDYLKLEESFRKEGVKIKIIRSFNPPPKEHWIWKDYDLIPITEEELTQKIEDLSQEDNIKELVISNRKNGQRIDNIYLRAEPKGYKHIAIEGNYGINRKNLSEDAIRKYELRKYTDFDYYCRTYLGLITSGAERAVLTGAKKITLQDFIEAEGNLLYGLDFGNTAPNALTLNKIDEDNKLWYSLELLYKPDTEENLIKALERLNISKQIPIIPDQAGRHQINALRQAGYYVIVVSKSHDANVSAIKDLRTYKMHFCGENLWNEYLNWQYSENKTGEMLEDEVPKKGNDHLMDGIKYVNIGKRHAVNNFNLNLI